MTGLYRDRAVVLRTWKLGESDRIASLITENNGKVRCVAKGVRKTKSRFGSRVEPGSHLDVQLYEGRGELHTLTQVESIANHRAIREDLELFARVSSMLEAVEHVSQDHEPKRELYVMLHRAITTIVETNSSLVVAGFFTKLVASEGFAPALDVCVRCGTTDDLTRLSPELGGTVCSRCGLGQPVSVDAMALLHLVLGGQLGLVLNQAEGPGTQEFDHLSTRLLENMLERRLRSAAVLEQA